MQLTTIPKTLSTEIQVLSLNENHILQLNREEFTTLGLNNLQRIYLKRSHISSVHRDAFKNLKILIEIDLSENEIDQLDRSTFNGNDRLRVLYLNGNPLKILQAHQFPVLPHLRSLDLHNCQISNIDPLAFANLELLELLNLKSNLMQSLDESVFHYMGNLKALMLEGNPWLCDCHLRHFRNWFITTKLRSASLICNRPNALQGKTWESIDEHLFGCPPTVDVFSDDIFNVDIGSNVTLSCLVTGDPLPKVTWELNGRDIIDDNVMPEDETHTNRLWRNITIFNITNYDAGIYVCTAHNDIATIKRNVSIYLTEIVQHVIEKGPETFWYFGLILGTFGTVFGLIILSFLVCVCKKTTQRRRSIKNIKGSVSFNDQEKKLLDLSITTNDRAETIEGNAHTPSTGKIEPVIALEPVQITIENLSRNDDFPLNVGVFTPPPEFCTQQASSIAGTGVSSTIASSVSSTNNGTVQRNQPSPAYGNIFISVALTQDAIDNHEQMYPDLLNIPNRVIGKLFPINVSSYATLPRNRLNRNGNSIGMSTIGESNCNQKHQKQQKSTKTLTTSSSIDCDNNISNTFYNNKNSRLQNVINYQNLDTTTTHLNESGSIGLCSGCLKTQDEQYVASAAAAAAAANGVINGRTISSMANTSTSLNIDLNNGQTLAPTTIDSTMPSSTSTTLPVKHHHRCIMYPSKYDNMGRRITASGNSILSIPDEEKEINFSTNRICGHSSDEKTMVNNTIGGGVASIASVVGLPASCSGLKNNSKLNDRNGNGVNSIAVVAPTSSSLSSNSSARMTNDDKMRNVELHGTILLPPTGNDYVSL